MVKFMNDSLTFNISLLALFSTTPSCTKICKVQENGTDYQQPRQKRSGNQETGKKVCKPWTAKRSAFRNRIRVREQEVIKVRIQAMTKIWKLKWEKNSENMLLLKNNMTMKDALWCQTTTNVPCVCNSLGTKQRKGTLIFLENMIIDMVCRNNGKSVKSPRWLVILQSSFIAHVSLQEKPQPS